MEKDIPVLKLESQLLGGSYSFTNVFLLFVNG